MIPIAHNLLDTILIERNLKNDAHLSRVLGYTPPVISKIRNGGVAVSGETVIRIHEAFDIPVKRIKELAGLPRFDAK